MNIVSVVLLMHSVQYSLIQYYFLLFACCTLLQIKIMQISVNCTNDKCRCRVMMSEERVVRLD